MTLDTAPQDTSHEPVSRSVPPPLREIRDFSFRQAERTMLDNGLPVYYINAGVQEVIKADLIFRSPAFDKSQPLLHSAANRLMSEGTAKYSAQQLAEMVDYFGAYYETEQSPDNCSVILHSLNRHFARTLPVIYEMITDAAFPVRELGIYIQNNKQRLQVENEKVGSIARRKFSEIIFGNENPYGHCTSAGDYDTLSQETLLAFHRRQYVSNHCTILLSGRVGSEELKTLNDILGRTDWTRGNGIEDPGMKINPSGEKIHYMERENAIQSAIRIGKPLFNKTHPDYPGMLVLNTVLGGYFGSRLMKNIREDKGYTYGIGSAAVSMMRSGYFFITSEVGAEVCSAALEEIYKEIEILKKEPVSESELQMVKNYMLGSFLKSIDGAFNLADRLKGIMYYNLGYDYYDRFIKTVQGITSQRLMELATTYLERESFYELVVGRK